MAECQRVSARQWRWAVAGAAVAAGVAAALGAWLGPNVVGYFGATAVTAALPLVMRNHPKACARTCYVVGVGLLIWSLLGAMIGMLWFIPAALLLLVAAFADADNRPGARFAVITPLAAIAAVAAMAHL
ncbi:hypothetical protein ABZW18_34390 [Streptomyces sp. NPDC004647]|uniref:hypothetical protein n=1 Tax=Streptomyces sp. NPDC004647 TaxID=3154671 RepID=UPI0033A69A63